MSDRDDKLRTVVDLTSRLADDQLDSAGVAQLEGLLFGDPEACELYLNVTTLHAHLSRDFGGAVPVDVRPFGGEANAAPTASYPIPIGSIAPPDVRRGGPASRRRGFWHIGRYAAAAGVALFVGVVSVLAVRSGSEPADACATLVEVRGPAAEWAECSRPHKAGDRLGPQTIGLARGMAVVRFDNGATATLAGPFELLIESRRSAELKRGSVLVRSDREQSGFTLKTAASDFVDLGTEFGVATNDDASSEVHVFQGVVITRPRASDAVVPVLGNEAGRVDIERGDLVAVDLNRTRFPGVTTALPAASHPIASSAGSARTRGPLPRDARIVFVGDQATDRETHLLFVSQTLAKQYADGGPRPRLFDAGGAMPLSFDEVDLRRQVLAHRPTHTVIEYGPEIAAGPGRLPAERFERELRGLADRLTAEGVEPILATGFPLGERQAQCQGVLDGYNAAIRRVAADGGYRLADVDAHFRALSGLKLSLVAPAGATPTCTGYREMAGVLLGAMGYPGAKVDPSLKLSLLPGAVTQWRYRLKPAGDRLTAARATALPTLAAGAVPTAAPAAAPGGLVPPPADGEWRDLTLPQPDDKFCTRYPDATHAPGHRDRVRGFAVNLHKGADKSVEAVATVESSEDRPAFLNTGAEVRAVWLNGQKVFDAQDKPTAWHAGAERLPVSLRAGANHVVVEAGRSFFISVTDDYDWPVQ